MSSCLGTTSSRNSRPAPDVHVAFFNRSYYPDTAATGQLLTELCEGLVRDHGCRVTVIAGVPLLPQGGAGESAGSHRRMVTRERHNGVDILRARGTRFSKRRFIGRASNYVSYFLSASLAGIQMDRPDIIVCLTDPPIIGLAGWLAAKRFRVPLVMAYQDIFPEVGRLLEDFHSNTVDTGLQKVNEFLCTRATRVVALGETMRTRLIENKGANPTRTVVIANWADTAVIAPAARHNAFRATHRLTDKFVVMHSGNIGLSQGLETVIEAAALLREVRDLQIVIQGEGVRKPALQALARELQLSNVTFLPFQPKERLAEAFAAADVFVVSLQRGLAGYIVPSKLYGILAAGRPFVAAVEDACEVSSLASRYECGLVCEPGNARELADAIVTFYRDPRRIAQFGVNARNASLLFDRSAQIAKYMNLFREIRPVSQHGTPMAAEKQADVA
jgi:colanic acid biosynthesis glycosyl transferase WcaI